MSRQQIAEKQIVSPISTKEDKIMDLTLRPKTWDGFVGQEKIKKNLKIILGAAKKREQICEHLLFYGNQGLGKTTLSYLVAQEMGGSVKTVSGPTIEKVGDFAAILTNLQKGDILFLDECHRLNKIIEEFLYPAMEEYKLHLILGRGPMARTMDLDLPKFTLIGATTRIALLSAPLRNRFGATFQLDFYGLNDIEEIIERSAKILNVQIEPVAIKVIAKRARFTPRVANRLLKRARDWAEIESDGIVTEDAAKKALESLEIDEIGLESGDIRILKTLVEKFNGGPAGLQALASASFEEEDTILDIYEPYLMQLGFIERTPRGRIATNLAYKHLKIKQGKNQKRLLV